MASSLPHRNSPSGLLINSASDYEIPLLSIAESANTSSTLDALSLDSSFKNQLPVPKPSFHYSTIDPSLLGDERAVPSAELRLRKIHLFLRGRYGRASMWARRFLVGLIFVNIFMMIMHSDPQITATWGEATFDTVEGIATLVFTVEYFLRMWSCIVDYQQFGKYGPILGRLRFVVSLRALVDLCTVIPWYLEIWLGEHVSFIMILRVLRFFSVFKFDKYARAFRILNEVFVKESELLITSLFMCVIVWMLASSLFYVTDGDRDMFKTVPDALYTVFQLLQGTFPWGDGSDVGVISTIFLCILCALGYALWAVPMGVIASGFVLNMSERRAAVASEKAKEEKEYHKQLAMVSPVNGNGIDDAPSFTRMTDSNDTNSEKEDNGDDGNEDDDDDDIDIGDAPHCASCSCCNDASSPSSSSHTSPTSVPSLQPSQPPPSTSLSQQSSHAVVDDAHLLELQQRVAAAQADLIAYRASLASQPSIGATESKRHL